MDCDHNYIVVDCTLIKVKVPKQKLMKPYFFNTKEKLWFWSYDGNNNYYYEKNAKCRLKVLDVSFKTVKDIEKMIDEKMNEEKMNEENDIILNKEDLMNSLQKEDIMEIYCSMSQKGLGPIKWWD